MRLKFAIRLLCFLFITSPFATHAEDSSIAFDTHLYDRPNDNDTLLTFVAGLAGEESWSTFLPFIESDPSFEAVDFLVYETPKSLNIEQNAQRLYEYLVSVGQPYENIVYIGHSIGGLIIRRMMLQQIERTVSLIDLPYMVITYGTPFYAEAFNITTVRNVIGNIARSLMPVLWREVFDLEGVATLTHEWRTAVRREPLDATRCISVFGIEDDIAPAVDEKPSDVTVFIRGDHMTIVSPTNSQACSVLILKALLNDANADLQSLSCTL